jgi:hypothetical protein
MNDVRSISCIGALHVMSLTMKLGHRSIHRHSGKFKLNLRNTRRGGGVMGEYRQKIQKIKCLKIT